MTKTGVGWGVRDRVHILNVVKFYFECWTILLEHFISYAFAAITPTPTRRQDDTSSDSAVSMGSQSAGSPEQVRSFSLNFLTP